VACGSPHEIAPLMSLLPRRAFPVNRFSARILRGHSHNLEGMCVAPYVGAFTLSPEGKVVSGVRDVDAIVSALAA